MSVVFTGSIISPESVVNSGRTQIISDDLSQHAWFVNREQSSEFMLQLLVRLHTEGFPGYFCCEMLQIMYLPPSHPLSGFVNWEWWKSEVKACVLKIEIPYSCHKTFAEWCLEYWIHVLILFCA
jgi:hypothetical protein